MILARTDVNAEDAKGRLNGGRSSDHTRLSALNVATRPQAKTAFLDTYTIDDVGAYI
jgi:hypothetical protein